MNIFVIAQIPIGIILIASILLQQRGTGMGSAFGGESGVYRSKRGVERILFILTIVFSILFAINAMLAVITS